MNICLIHQQMYPPGSRCPHCTRFFSSATTSGDLLIVGVQGNEDADIAEKKDDALDAEGGASE